MAGTETAHLSNSLEVSLTRSSITGPKTCVTSSFVYPIICAFHKTAFWLAFCQTACKPFPCISFVHLCVHGSLLDCISLDILYNGLQTLLMRLSCAYMRLLQFSSICLAGVAFRAGEEGLVIIARDLICIYMKQMYVFKGFCFCRGFAVHMCLL